MSKRNTSSPESIPPIHDVQVKSDLDHQSQILLPPRISKLMEIPLKDIQIITVTGVERQ